MLDPRCAMDAAPQLADVIHPKTDRIDNTDQDIVHAWAGHKTAAKGDDSGGLRKSDRGLMSSSGDFGTAVWVVGGRKKAGKQKGWQHAAHLGIFHTPTASPTIWAS